ncbi:MAG TPA: methylated-DNA--[protein]-cysteine S-methyltransferase [Gemmatimonadales bacterium]
MTLYDIIDTPIGELTLTATDEGLTGVHFAGDGQPAGARPLGGRDGSPAAAVLAAARAQLAAYFAGELVTFDLPLVAHGTPFQERVWVTLRGIGHGETISYTELARRVGSPRAVRAVGGANGRNPIPIVVPCHRVIAAGGKLGGFGGGLDRKQWLLEHEGVMLGAGARGRG